MSKSVLQNEWFFLLVFIGFEIFCYKFWNNKTDDVHWNLWKYYFQKKNYKYEILNHLYFGPSLIFCGTALGCFSSVVFLNFLLSVNHVGWHFYSVPLPLHTIKKLPMALLMYSIQLNENFFTWYSIRCIISNWIFL